MVPGFSGVCRATMSPICHRTRSMTYHLLRAPFSRKLRDLPYGPTGHLRVPPARTPSAAILQSACMHEACATVTPQASGVEVSSTRPTSRGGGHLLPFVRDLVVTGYKIAILLIISSLHAFVLPSLASLHLSPSLSSLHHLLLRFSPPRFTAFPRPIHLININTPPLTPLPPSLTGASPQ